MFRTIEPKYIDYYYFSFIIFQKTFSLIHFVQFLVEDLQYFEF